MTPDRSREILHGGARMLEVLLVILAGLILADLHARFFGK